MSIAKRRASQNCWPREQVTCYIVWRLFRVLSNADASTIQSPLLFLLFFFSSSNFITRVVVITKKSRRVGRDIVFSLRDSFFSVSFFSLGYMSVTRLFPAHSARSRVRVRVFKYRFIIVVAIYMKNSSCYANLISCHFYLLLSTTFFSGIILELYS